MHDWFDQLLEPALAAHVAVVAFHAALLAAIAGFGPNAPIDRDVVEINLHGGVPKRGLRIDWTPRQLDLDAILEEARRQAEGIVRHLNWDEREGGGDE